MFNSEAFSALSGKEVKMLLTALNQLEFEKTSKTKQGARASEAIKNEGRVYLTENELKARGITGKPTITKGKRKLVEIGFLDVVETGSVHHPAVFKISDRWRKYPDGDYRRKDQIPIGRSLHAEHSLANPEHPIHKKRREDKLLRSEFERSTESFSERSEEPMGSKIERKKPEK